MQYQVNGLTYVVLSSTQTFVDNGRSVCVELSQFPARPSASVQKIKVATMRCGCTWTLLAISVLTRKTRAVGPPQRKVLAIPA